MKSVKAMAGAAGLGGVVAVLTIYWSPLSAWLDAGWFSAIANFLAILAAAGVAILVHRLDRRRDARGRDNLRRELASQELSALLVILEYFRETVVRDGLVSDQDYKCALARLQAISLAALPSAASRKIALRADILVARMPTGRPLAPLYGHELAKHVAELRHIHQALGAHIRQAWALDGAHTGR